ncbi:hypothetical protein [Spiroplasma endosymbiont of Danaus chrysippus]|uniref:hypothetical protein n=1 Tax=Spiroplasma endosymbiont of Danaus chrysippus TaxID=2691041 RepID=UPI00157A6D23|nr:hypothetical protein [Spiroplasma endosymbiont of Danaus chrysippus]
MKKIINLLRIIMISSTINSTLINNKNSKVINISQNMLQQNIKESNDILFEKDYRFLAHDWLKVKISNQIFEKDFKEFYFDNIKHKSEIKNHFFEIINNFPRLDNTSSGGSITENDIFTFVNVIINNFEEIIKFYNDFLHNYPDTGLIIVTNTIRSWDKNDNMGIFKQT